MFGALWAPKYDHNLCINDRGNQEKCCLQSNTHTMAYCRGEGLLGHCVIDDKRQARGCVRRHR